MRVAVRVDAGPLIGGGHAMRCLTLADALSADGAQVTFISAAMPESLAERIRSAGHRLAGIEPSPEMQRSGPQWHEPALSEAAQNADVEATRDAAGAVDWLIVDHYLLDARWHSRARAFADRLLVIDDLANRSCDCDLLLDQTFGRDPAAYANRIPDHAAVMAGSTFALLRPEFARERRVALDRRRQSGAVHKILVSVGTADLGGITAAVVDAVLTTSTAVRIHVVLGREAPSLEQVRSLASCNPAITLHVDSDRMAELMRDADLAIGAAGTTSLERCCLGLPAIVLMLADNQREGAAALSNAGALLAVESLAAIGSALERLIGDQGRLQRMSAAAFAIADGLGTQRVVRAMNGSPTLASQGVELRPAGMEDSETLWLWRNDWVTRMQSRNSDPITWQDHVRWLAAVLGDPNRHLFIAECAGALVGTIRFDALPEGGHEVSVGIAAEPRGTGYGSAILKAGCARLGASAIHASIRHDNGPSRRLFEKCGFKPSKSPETGFVRYVLAQQPQQIARKQA